ncbi:hypothetical protein MYX06_03135 [Patescibacteria group bacterium AH-259-L05]|nr:hypothetical protein [Patescibacteria group bacterium AH-259-L05]
MTIKTTKVKNGSITLPKGLRKKWSGAEVYISDEKDMISIKRLSMPSLTFKKMLDEFNKAGKKISRNEVEKVISEVRSDKTNVATKR